MKLEEALRWFHIEKGFVDKTTNDEEPRLASLNPVYGQSLR